MFNIGYTLGTLGARQGDDVMSSAAINAFRAALEVRTRAQGWARTQRQLGEALIALGERTIDPRMLSQAV
jgi:hypothetical protein